MVILDTNIIIDHLRSTSKKRHSVLMDLVDQSPKAALAISLVSVQELFEGRSTLLEESEKNLLATISPLRILPYTYEVAKLAGTIARDIQQPIELADAAIAATTILNQARLYTLNRKDFQGIAELELLAIKK